VIFFSIILIVIRIYLFFIIFSLFSLYSFLCTLAFSITYSFLIYLELIFWSTIYHIVFDHSL